MSAKRTFSSYQQVLMTMKRSNIKDPGVTATLLLETFVHRNGDLRATTVVHKGLCDEGKFIDWRDDLIKKGWLCYSIGDYSKHTAGPKLVKYINKEKLVQSEIATMADVNVVDRKVTALQEEVSHLKKVVTQMIEEFDPPATTEKIEKRLKVVKNQK
jgi:hypothetical protein